MCEYICMSMSYQIGWKVSIRLLILRSASLSQFPHLHTTNRLKQKGCSVTRGCIRKFAAL